MVQSVRRQYRAYAGFVTTPQFFDDSPTQFLKVAPPGTGIIQRVNHIDEYEFTLDERARNFGVLEESAICLGRSRCQVIGQANTSSRYGPTAPLAGLGAALDRGRPFAVIAKPCDLGAVHALSTTDSRVDELCVTRLALVCGGQSRLSKSQAVLEEFGVDEDDVALFRYRGHGNPGATVVETRSGDRFTKTYLDMWADESHRRRTVRGGAGRRTAQGGSGAPTAARHVTWSARS